MCWYHFYWIQAVGSCWIPVLVVGKSNGCACEEVLSNSFAMRHFLGAGEKECIHQLEMDEDAMSFLHCCCMCLTPLFKCWLSYDRWFWSREWSGRGCNLVKVGYCEDGGMGMQWGGHGAIDLGRRGSRGWESMVRRISSS